MEIFPLIISVFILILQNGAAIPPEPYTTMNPLTTTPSDHPYCSRKGISCYDPYTLQHCTGTGESSLEFTVTCKTQNPNRPFCMEYENKVECVDGNISLPLQTQPEVCNSQGLRPDPLDCSRYIQCEKMQNGYGFFGSVVNCPSGTLYDINQQRCTEYSSCYNIYSDCIGNEGRLIAYKFYPSIFVKCPAANSVDEIIVKLCKNGYDFNEDIGACQQICQQEGFLPDYKNCKAYYNCVRNSDELFSITHNICPIGTGFNRHSKLCDERKSNCINSKSIDFDDDF